MTGPKVVMRYLFGLIFVLALGVMPPVGCGPLIESGSCSGIVCPDDGNDCTREFCRCDGWWCTPECTSAPADNGTDCTFDSFAGVCVEGVCGEDLCEGVVCDDDDACTDNECDYVDGTCDFPPAMCDDRNECTGDTCNPVDGCIFTPAEDREGTICESPIGVGMCEAGVCSGCDPASQEELQCPIEGLEGFVCCPGAELCSDTCAPCDPASEVEYQCPVNEEAVCCPGSEYCMFECSSGS